MSSTPVRSTRHSTPASLNKSTDTTQLPSPPSSQEDSLLNNKRKRQVSGTPNPKLRLPGNAVSITPNPKPRKQTRLISSPVIESPTKQRARTPVTRYEPPREQFTPPREITLSPSKTQRTRSAIPKGRMVIQVKHEKPDIDLSIPLPPASPSDDPILLRGRARKFVYDVDNDVNSILEDIEQPVFSLPNTTNARASPDSNNTDSSPSNASTSQLCPSSSPPKPPAIPTYFDFSSIPERGPSDSDMTDDEDEPMPVFSLTQPPVTHNDDWSSDESEGEEGEGDYTGTFHTLIVPTKPDPPTSTTKARMDEWESKVRRSPHPKAVVQYSSSPSRAEVSNNNTLPSLSEDEDDQLPPSDDGDEDPSHKQLPTNPADERHLDNNSITEYADDPPEGQPVDSNGVEEEEQSQLPSPPSSPLPPPFESILLASPSNAFTSTPHVAGNGFRPEFDFSTFVTPSAIASTSVAPHDWMPDQVSGASEDEVENEPEENPIAFDASLIKISSSDPFAAARATAILKAHDYECFTRASFKRSFSRDVSELTKNANRRNLSAASIRKSPFKSPRKAVGIRGDSVYFEASPMRTLPDLLDDAEEEVSVERSILNDNMRRHDDQTDEDDLDPFFTPPPRVRVKRNVGGEWGKEDWKALDACFTDERLAFGSEKLGEDILANVNEIDLAAVVQRFTELYEYDMNDFAEGPWSKKGLLKRAYALRTKQQNGKGAPPTSRHPRRSSSAFSFRNDSPSLQVPDFTPSARRYAKRPILPEPSNEQNPFSHPTRVPKTLLAPRYSHLLDEARAVSFSSPIIVPTPPKDEPSEPPMGGNGLGKRVKGLIYSYLKSSSPGPSQSTDKSSSSFGLPPPPPLNGPRAPINTPARPVFDKPTLPHVDLNHVPTPVKPEPTRQLLRKGSSGSVKDLVKSFEDSISFEREKETINALKQLKGEKRVKSSRLPIWKP